MAILAAAAFNFSANEKSVFLVFSVFVLGFRPLLVAEFSRCSFFLFLYLHIADESAEAIGHICLAVRPPFTDHIGRGPVLP